MVVEESYEYVPPGGDPGRPIEIHGFAPYLPGQRRTIERFAFRVPPGSAHDIPDRLVVAGWPDVVAKLLETFPDETADGLAQRMKATVPFGSCMP